MTSNATRKYRRIGGETEHQELNDTASMIAKFCDKQMEQFEDIKDKSEWADGYYDAVNTMRAIINGSSHNLVCKS